MDWESLPIELFGKRIPNLVEAVMSFGWTMDLANLAILFKKDSCPPFYVAWKGNPESGKWNFEDSKVVLPPTDGNPWPRLSYNDTKVYAANPNVILPEKPPERPKGLVGAWGPYAGK